MRSVLLFVLMLGFTNVVYAKKAQPSRSAKAMFPTYYELMKLSPRVRTVYLRNLAKAIGEFERATHGPLTKTAELELRQTEELFAMMSFLPQATAADAPGSVGVPKFRMEKVNSYMVKYAMDCPMAYVWNEDVGTCVVAGSQKDFYGDFKSKVSDWPCATGERVAVKGWYGSTSYCVSKDALDMAGNERAKSLREGKASDANAAQSGSGLTQALTMPGGVMSKALNTSFGSAGRDVAKQTELAQRSTGTNLLQGQLAQQSLPSLDHRDVENQVAKAVKVQDEKNAELAQAQLRGRNFDTPNAQDDVAKTVKADEERGARLAQDHLRGRNLDTPNAQDDVAQTVRAEDERNAKLVQDQLRDRNLDTPDAQDDVTKTVKAEEEKGAKLVQAHFNAQGIQPQTALQAGNDECAAFRCNSATATRKEQDQLREKYKATKNKSCTIGGMPSKYRDGDVRRGNCETITKIAGTDIKCSAKETLCNPALYCVPNKKGQEAVFCVDPKAEKGHVQLACRDKHLAAWKETNDPTQNCIESAPFNGVAELYTATVSTYTNLCFNPDPSFRTFFCAECDMLSLRIQNANREAYKTGCLVTMNRDNKAPTAAPVQTLPEEVGTGDAKVTQ